MKLFLFLVGGTGARVLRPLIMQFAAGVRPIDPHTGEPMNNLEVVPIIMDPHRANKDLQRTDNLLRWYREIRNSLYGNRTDVTRGFFNVKVSTLSDLNPNSSLSNSFVFNLGDIAAKEFHEFISYNTLSDPNQALCSMLFSDDHLHTKMDIGFVGSPNIGSVALNQFKDSEEFRQFANVFRSDDRVFVVSSIFGGTGAAGFPIIVKNIRDAEQNSTLSNKGDLRDAKIGALTVLPYFNVEADENSPISRADFVIKTKSALYYYEENLTGPKSLSLNACYYLGDEVPSNPYPNDPGNNGQQNDAHYLELIGALSIIDFLQIPDDKLCTRNGRAENPLFREYGLNGDALTLTLMKLGAQTRALVNTPMVKLHLLYMYLTHAFKQDVGRGYTEDKPELKASFVSTSFYRTLTNDFFHEYLDWLREMGRNQRCFVPFRWATSTIDNCISDVQPKKGFLGMGTIDYKTLLSALNRESAKASKESRYTADELPLKLCDLIDRALDRIIPEKYTSVL